MKLENETLDILKNFATINPSLLVKKGNVLKTISLAGSVIAKATLKQEFESDFAVYDLPNFLSALSMFNETQLTFKDKRFVTLSNAEKTAMINYYYADPDIVIKPPEKDFDLPTTKIKFRLTKQTLADVLKATSILAMPEVSFVCDGKQVSVQTVNPKIASSSSYSKVIGESTIEFKAFFKIENIKFIPNDYDVSVIPPKSAKGTGIAHFSAPGIEYWVAVEEHSVLR